MCCIFLGIPGQSLKCLEVKEFVSQLEVAAHWSLFNRALQSPISVKELQFSKLSITTFSSDFQTRSHLIINLETSQVILADRRKVGSKFSYSSQIVRLSHNRLGVWRIHRLAVKTCKSINPFSLVYSMVCIVEMHLKVAWQGPPGYGGVGRGLWRPLIWGLSSSPVLPIKVQYQFQYTIISALFQPEGYRPLQFNAMF